MDTDQRQKFDEAVRLKEQGELAKAKGILLELHRHHQASAAILAVLADVCWDLGQLDEAISFFRKAASLRPNSEAISLGLFHCLYEAGDIDAAFNEMRRFLMENESEEYRRLIDDINSNR